SLRRGPAHHLATLPLGGSLAHGRRCIAGPERRGRARKKPLPTGGPRVKLPTPRIGGTESIMSYAVIKTGGKQYRVSEGDRIRVEKLPGDVGTEVSFDEVLMVGGDKVAVGTPLVSGATVKAKIVAQDR